MLNGPRPTRIEQVDWRSVLPWLRMWDNFVIATRPTHLLLSLAMLLGVLLVVLALDDIFDRQAKVGEIHLHAHPQLARAVDLMPGAADTRLNLRRATYELDDAYVMGQMLARVWDQHHIEGDLTQERMQLIADLAVEQPRSIFFASLAFEADSLQRLMAAVFNGDWQLGQLIHGQRPDRLSVAGVLLDWYWLTHWWITHHPLPMAVYSLLAYLLWITFGGTLHRSVAKQAVKNQHAPVGESVGFMRQRLGRLLLTPLIPVVFAAGLGLVLLLTTWLLSSAIDGLNIVGGLLMIIAAPAALLMAIVAVLYLAMVHLVLPAIAVDDADIFDAISRSVHYVVIRPWRLAGYALLALLHGLVTFAIVGLVAWLALTLLHTIAMAAFGPETVGHAMTPDAPDLAALLPEPGFLQFFYWPDMDQLAGTQVFAGWLVGICGSAITLTVWAFAVSYYVTACTQIYLLLRQSADLVDPTVLDGGVWEAPTYEADEGEGDDDDSA